MDLVIAPDAAAAAEEGATWLALQLRTAASLRGTATVALSGGSTPAAMIAALVDLAVPWDDTTIFQVDERVAPDGDPDRNASMLDVLRRRGPTIHLMPVTDPDLESAADHYAALLPPRLDVVHLGFGDDGHTASWPPGDPVIDAGGAVAMSREYKGRVRMTLTPHAVNAARRRLVPVTGAGKSSIVERWVLNDPALPASRVNRVGAYVVLDAAAATRLPYQAG